MRIILSCSRCGIVVKKHVNGIAVCCSFVSRLPGWPSKNKYLSWIIHLRFDLSSEVKGQDFELASIEDVNGAGKGKRKKKLQGGNPSKRHRDRLNTELDNLARLLPFPEDTISKLDKISILRLTVSYLKAKSYFQVCATKKSPAISPVGQNDLSSQFEGNGLMSQLLLEALDGFIMIITTDGQLFYVSESVKDFLGYSQAALIHQSLFKFLHIDDHKSVKENLVWVDNNGAGVQEDDKADGKNESEDVFNSSKREKNFTCRIKCTLSHGGGFYKMFQCRGKMREMHIKKRDVDNVEYGLFAVISPVNTLPSASTMEMVRKEAMLATQRRFQIDQNLNITGTYPPTSQYKNYLDPHRLRPPMTPNSEPLTPTNHDATLRPSFFPPSFTYSNSNYLRPGLKRRSSSSSGVNDDSSTTDENASSEGSNDGNGPRRRVSFFLGGEEKAADYGKREKIGQRRMSAPTFPSTPVTSTAYEAPYSGMNTNWLFPNPLTNPFLSYQDLLHRMDTRPYMTSGLLSPMFPGYSPGGMFGPYSPNPFMKRAASFPNVNPAAADPMLYPGLNGMMGDTGGLMSPSGRVHGYDPFSYFMNNPLTSRRSSCAEGSPATSSSKHEEIIEEKREKEEEKECSKEAVIVEEQKPDDEDVEINVTEESEPRPAVIPIIRVDDYDSDKNHCEQKSEPNIEQNNATIDDDSKTSSNDDRPNESDPEKDSSEFQETLADIAQSFTSKLDSIRSSFTLSLDRNVASCLGKK